MQQKPITEAIVIHPHLIQKFMKYQKDYANLLALYTFYLYNAQLPIIYWLLIILLKMV